MHTRGQWFRRGGTVAAVLLLAAQSALAAQPGSDPAAIARGRAAYQRNGCRVCHGVGGSGGVRNRNAMTDEHVAAMTSLVEGYSAEEVREGILEGVSSVQKKNPEGPTPPLVMPAFSGILSEEEVGDLAAYLMSLASAPPEAVEEAVYPVPSWAQGEGNCQVCHKALVEKFAANIHAKAFPEERGRAAASLTCTSCHGPGDRHAQNPSDPSAILDFAKESPTPAHERNAACLACHERGLRFSWGGSAHESKEIACTDCHQIMNPVSERNLFVKADEKDVCFQCHSVRRAQLQRTTHMPLREGKVTCTDCHNPHGTASEKLLTANTVNDVCYRCHAEKRGPFLWEHPPVAENCLNCHEPHGSNHASLLKSERPRLCQRCHIESRHPTTPQAVNARFVFNRSCQNCHSQIHGSNHPSGVRFQR